MREMADEEFVFVRFRAAEFVVDVEDGGGAIELMENVGEKDGVGASGDCYSDSAGDAALFECRREPMNQALF